MSKTGIELIAVERQEQIDKHGCTVEYDVQNWRDKQLLTGVLAVLSNSNAFPREVESNGQSFPGEWNYEMCMRMYDKSYKDRLIIAGALIAAELDRLLYSESHRGERAVKENISDSQFEIMW